MSQDKITFDSMRHTVQKMDTTGFFVNNGMFGLEMRDELLAQIDDLEEQYQALLTNPQPAV